MNKRIVIESVRIKNFRSIRNELIEAKNLNVFVGMNDVGKSNVLKALNLFFNGQTDYGVPFDFQKDFSYYFPKSSHSTKEIVIEIRFIIPDTYKEKGIFTWRKVWRTNDYTNERILNSEGEEPSDRSRVPGTLKRIKFRYVPAVKSKEYYKSLLSDLYYTVSAVLDSPLESSVKGFSDVLKEYTSQISDEVSVRVGINSRLSIPDNLSELFRTLIFQTQGDIGECEIPLDMRGDGIQARHIPIILKYIADEDQKTRNQGSMKVSTIWGFEEPENGVELSRAFEMAKDFMDFSEDIQMFITTHSPAFYMISNTDTSRVIFVSNGEKNDGTKLTIADDKLVTGASMGLMPLVAPFIAEKEEQIANAKKLAEQNGLYDIPTIFVEGKTDKEYLELAIKLYSPNLFSMLNSNQLRVYTKENEGGCRKLIDWTYAWIYSGNKSKALILFDKDIAADIARKELIASDIYKTKRSSAMISVKHLEPSDSILSLKKKHIEIPYEIEHLLSSSFWEIIKEKGYMENRTAEELVNMVGKYVQADKSILDIIKEKVDNDELVNSLVLYNPKDDKKDKVVTLLKKCNEECQKEYMENFRPTIALIEKIFVDR